MSEATPFALSQLFTNLIGRKVAVSLAKAPVESKVAQVYGEYSVLPWERALVVKMDLPLLVGLGGALLGLPAAVALERAQETPMNPSVQDAIHEVLNVASAVLSKEGRVVLKKMVVDRFYLDADCAALLKQASVKACFQVAIEGQGDGLLTMMTNL